MFEFQHSDGRTGYYDFVIAMHKETKEIHGVLGYINSSTYDGGDRENPRSISGALWKVRPDVNNREIKKVGLELLFFLLKKFPNTPYMALGLSHDSQFIYKFLHMPVEKMNHYYIANRNCKDFRICVNPVVREGGESNEDVDLRLMAFDEIPEIENDYCPRKDRNYLRGRYYSHPFFTYRYVGVFESQCLSCVWVVRKIEINGSACLRLVDMVGRTNMDVNLSRQVNELLAGMQSEYMDCYNFGITPDIFFKMGFSKVGGDTVIPNYFEPYVLENVEIYCSFLFNDKIVMFKADGDQDRPNIIPSNHE